VRAAVASLINRKEVCAIPKNNAAGLSPARLETLDRFIENFS
jgi:hypothetical protein